MSLPNAARRPARLPRQSGFSLVEILLVIGVISVLAVGAFFVYDNVRDNAHAKQATDQAMDIAAAIRTRFGHRPITGLTTTNVVSSGILSADDLVTPWGTGMNLWPLASGRHLTISFLGATPKVCVKFISRIEPASDMITVGDATIIKRKATIGSPVEYSGANALIQCGSAPVTPIKVVLPI